MEKKNSTVIFLVADKYAEDSLAAILDRYKERGLVTNHRILRHPQHDPGCYHESEEMLRPFINTYDYAIVIFDREGSGAEEFPRAEIESEVEKKLSRSGWNDRCAVIVIDPELENWVWSQSPHVSEILGWGTRRADLTDWLIEKRFLGENEVKPKRPKEALEEALRVKRIIWSSSIHKKIASRVSFENCVDESFNKLKTIIETELIRH